jgi:hypothetical protein
MSLIDDIVKLAGQTASDVLRLPGQMAGLLEDRLKQHPQEVFAALREVRPVFLHEDLAIVTHYPDVVEVLSHDAEFSVSGYAGPMGEITGEFILGLDQGPGYERAVSLLRLAFRQDDVPAVVALATQAARDCLAAAAGGTRKGAS